MFPLPFLASKFGTPLAPFCPEILKSGKNLMTTTSCPMCQADLSTGYSDTCNGCGADLSRLMPKLPQIAVFATPPEIESESNLGRGVLGACAGALVGSALMYGLFLAMGIRFPLFGTGIGALCGLGAKWLNKGGEEK